ncbi:MAG: Asp/Glu racemase [Alphaproteobacteria bacterium]|nr:Asp/Glu racemase [Alphaproteobacteria bacterium]
MRVIHCLHTAASNAAIFDAAARDFPTLSLRHAVRADLLADAEAAGGLTPGIANAVQSTLRAMPMARLLTCSTLGPAAEGLALRADAALAQEVMQNGQVVVLCAVETTLAPTTALFRAAGDAALSVRLVPGAWARFRAGDSAGYLAMIRTAAQAALVDGADRVALAQVSMAGAAGPRVLAAPQAALRAIIAGQAPGP